ncbi:unnamed protein product, partial [Prorocentrum cordatum]
DTLMKVIEPMHGQMDAPRRWWRRAVDDLKASGLKQHPLGPCLVVSYDKDGNCDGFVLLYVGDVLGRGDRKPGSNCDDVIEAVKRKFKFREWIEEDEVEHCGSDLHQTTHWGNKHSNGAEVNETLRFYRQNAGVGLKMKKFGKVSDIVLAAMADAAWGVRQDGSSYGGYVTMAFHSKVFDGEASRVIATCRIPAAAGMDTREFAKRFWAALIYDIVNVNVDESTHYAGESALAIEAKALDDATKKDIITSFQDKRPGIKVLALRERIEATQTQWKLVSSERQYADGLTKLEA